MYTVLKTGALVASIGVKPTETIAALALQKSVSLFENQYIVTAIYLRKKAYIDDIRRCKEDGNMRI